MENNLKAFFALLRAGLWTDVESTDLKIQGFTKSVDWEKIYQLAEEQSVVGLVLAGIEHSDVKPPQDLLLQWIGEVQMIEHQNKAMNEFVAKLIEHLRKNDVYALLVKGQGVAQCYEKPLWRSSGDIDLLLNLDNYNKAKTVLQPLASSIEEENEQALHLGLTINDWQVELHGTLFSCCLSQVDKIIDEVQESIFHGGNVRSWNNNNIQVFIPSTDNDVIISFTHILKHFFHGGVGVRQLCDWCRLLWTYRESLNHGLLEKRIQRAGIVPEWKAFAAFAVEYLGMPRETMPIYSPHKKWGKKAKKIGAYIIERGNFGHNVATYENNESDFASRKLYSFKRYTRDALQQLTLFPWNSLRVWLWVLKVGLLTMFKRNGSR